MDKIRVTKQQLWTFPLLGPKWDVTVGEITLASFISWRDAVNHAYKVADRVARQMSEVA